MCITSVSQSVILCVILCVTLCVTVCHHKQSTLIYNNNNNNISELLSPSHFPAYWYLAIHFLWKLFILSTTWSISFSGGRMVERTW